MATTENRAQAAEKATSRQEPEKKDKKQETKPASPRKRRPRTVKLPSVIAAIETDQLPEPVRSGAIALAQAIHKFFLRVWQELSGSGAAESAPLQLPPGRPPENAPSEAEQAARAPTAQAKTTRRG